MRQRLVVFVTVTLGVALAIAAAQGCENRGQQGRGGPAPHATADLGGARQGTPGVADVPLRPAAGADAVGGPFALPVREAVSASALSALGRPLPPVGWADRSYPDPDGGPAIRLRDGRATLPSGAEVTLTTVLPARYRGAAAAVVVLERTDGDVPVDLVELYGFDRDAPVLLAARASAADPAASAAWRIGGGALVREERAARGGAVTATRYTVRGDGTLEEAWLGRRG